MQVPFYQQRLDFTCGPACLLMAMRAHDPSVTADFPHEVDIWREATYGGVPATSRFGLALAAHRRGFRARVLADHDGIPFAKRMRERLADFYPWEVVHQLFEDTRRRAVEAGLTTAVRALTPKDVDDALAAGEVPIILTSTIHFDGEDEDIPHWVVVSERDDASGVYRVLNPLDDAPRIVDFDADAFKRAFGFGGETEMVAVGPRRDAA